MIAGLPPTAVPVPPGLADAFARGNVVAVVGSGLSIPCGAPSWTALIEGLAAEALDASLTDPTRLARCRTALAATTPPLDAAQLLKEILRADFPAAVLRQLDEQRPVDPAAVQAFRDGADIGQLWAGPERPSRNLAPNANQRMLMSLGFRAIITTNFDRLLEESSQKPPPVYSWSHADLGPVVRGGKPFILKLHGDRYFPSDITLASSDYDRVVHAPTRDALFSLFSTCVPLWIGYGHNDPDLDPLVATLKQRLSLKGGWSLCKGGDVLKNSRMERLDITPIELRSHDEVTPFLQRLCLTAGGQPVVTVGLEQPPDSDHRRTKVGFQIVDELNAAIGAAGPTELTLHPVAGAGDRLYVEAGRESLEKLQQRLAVSDTALLSLVGRLGVVSIDGSQFSVAPPLPARTPPPGMRSTNPGLDGTADLVKRFLDVRGRVLVLGPRESGMQLLVRRVVQAFPGRVTWLKPPPYECSEREYFSALTGDSTVTGACSMRPWLDARAQKDQREHLVVLSNEMGPEQYFTLIGDILRGLLFDREEPDAPRRFSVLVAGSERCAFLRFYALHTSLFAGIPILRMPELSVGDVRAQLAEKLPARVSDAEEWWHVCGGHWGFLQEMILTEGQSGSLTSRLAGSGSVFGLLRWRLEQDTLRQRQPRQHAEHVLRELLSGRPPQVYRLEDREDDLGCAEVRLYYDGFVRSDAAGQTVFRCEAVEEAARRIVRARTEGA